VKCAATASVAQTLYRETEASKEQRLKVAAERKAMRQFEKLPASHRNAIVAGSSSSGEEFESQELALT
jgi:hypothetical protein